jgi:uncharacterized MAPEG superfamily protein
MNHVSAIVLVALIAWALLLLVLMEGLRCVWIFRGRVAANTLRPDNANLSPFMQRLARAHANCVESLPLFGGLLLVALATGHASLTDALAPWMLGARLAQSGFHLASLHPVAVNLRFLAFVVQLAIAVYWSWQLLRLFV